MTILAPSVTFRPVQDSDTPFLRALFASTRAHEFAFVDWTPQAFQEFLDRQYDMQNTSYRMHYPGAAFTIIQVDGVDVGRLYVDRQDRCLRLIELTLAPEWCGRGLGTDLLRSLMNEAHGGKVPVQLCVQKESRALGLYLRHGFVVTRDLGHYHEMAWHPDTGPREI